MKAYFFLSNLSHQDYEFCTQKIKLIQTVSDVDTVLHNYTHKIGEDNTHRSQRAAFVELLSFIKYYLSHKL